MVKISKSNKDFLNKHKIPLSKVFDATGMGKKEYSALMKQLDKSVAIGVTPCNKSGHTLRNRHGHCIICSPAAMGFQKRHHANGKVYVVASQKLNLIKLGMATDVNDRVISLNQYNYANANDWVCVYWAKTKEAGELEFKAHQSLNDCSYPTSYLRGRKKVNCLETFSCPIQTAIDAIEINSKNIEDKWCDENLINTYNIKLKTGNSFKREHEHSVAAKPLYRSSVNYSGKKQALVEVSNSQVNLENTTVDTDLNKGVEFGSNSDGFIETSFGSTNENKNVLSKKDYNLSQNVDNTKSKNIKNNDDKGIDTEEKFMLFFLCLVLLVPTLWVLKDIFY